MAGRISPPRSWSLLSSALPEASWPKSWLDLVRSSGEAQKLADAQYRLGTTSIVEFTQAELNYTEAQLQDTQARFDFQVDRALLNFALGVWR